MYPSAGNLTGTLVQNILSHTHLSALGGETRPGVVHRLDKDTSGVMVFAKSDAAFRGLVKIFSAHELTRKYLAFVWGVPNWDGADITGNIARSSRNRQKMTMVKTGGKPAHTIVNVADAWPRAGVSLFRCTLMTGRTHQIRVHLSAHGFPVLCDPIYGRGAARLQAVAAVQGDIGAHAGAAVLDAQHLPHAQAEVVGALGVHDIGVVFREGVAAGKAAAVEYGKEPLAVGGVGVLSAEGAVQRAAVGGGDHGHVLRPL